MLEPARWDREKFLKLAAEARKLRERPRALIAASRLLMAEGRKARTRLTACPTESDHQERTDARPPE